MNYILRNVDADLWAKVKEKAALEGRHMRGVLMKLLELYAAGKIKL